MFWRRHYCYDCYRHHEWLSFKRGMAAMLILAFLVIGVLDYPAHAHHARKPPPGHSHAAAIHRPRHHHQPRHADGRQTWSRPEPAAPHRPARHAPRHRLPAGTASLAAAAQGLHWTSFHSVELPASASAGPHRTRGGLASEFADTPGGALLAAVNIAVRTAAEWGPAIFRPTITSQVTGPAAPELLRTDIRSHIQARRTSAGPPGHQTAASEEAYRFLAYAPDAATIDLVTSGPASDGNPVLVVTLLRVIWRHGDWRLIAPPSGNWARASAQISSLAGYTIFPSAG